ncbi:MAG: DUF433 domain-containing protein [Lunatimonas sp.]|uniref:DUF433 domain-containing protein n=1 Tax=Lunatimonas sp. TaxID=2060141 RepID=UPI00263BB31C|nr:DUF433 domain-containing protein [Lunatimonas sp.]MCC5937615.1 DUF433 domain-containing protein [Lunatimonas sp.]
MPHNQFIERNPEIMLGNPIIKGTRITVELLMRKLAGGYTLTDLLTSYPNLTKEHILASLEYAADIIANEESLENA